MTDLLILLSTGFYIKYKNLEKYNDTILPLFFLIAMLTLIFSGMAFLNEKLESKSHPEFTFIGLLNGMIHLGFGFWYFKEVYEAY